MFKFIPSISMVAGLLAVSSLGATSAQAASLNLSTWTAVGDASNDGFSAKITNAKANNADSDLSNLNFSGTNPIAPGSLEASLGLATGALGGSAQEGSGLYTDLLVGAGDIFSFNWSPFAFDTDDRIFATINGAIIDLTGPGTSFSSNSFTTTGTIRVGFGVIDQKDVLASSALAISNVDLTPATTAIPTPALLPGMIGFGLSLIRKRRSAV